MPRTLAMLLLLWGASLSASQPITKETVTSGGKPRTYYLFIPERPAGAAPAPLIVTLHGSGRNGRILVEHWERLASKEGIVLAGPDATDPQMWQYPLDAPEFLHDVVDDVKKKTAIDPRRVYLFGHSAGAIMGLQIGLIESEFYAAVAAHAGTIQPESYNLLSYARRKIPMFLAVGTSDALFPVIEVRATRDELQKHDFPVELWEISRHNHDYYSRSRDINDRAWQFLSKWKLEK